MVGSQGVTFWKTPFEVSEHMMDRLILPWGCLYGLPLGFLRVSKRSCTKATISENYIKLPFLRIRLIRKPVSVLAII